MESHVQVILRRRAAATPALGVHAGQSFAQKKKLWEASPTPISLSVAISFALAQRNRGLETPPTVIQEKPAGQQRFSVLMAVLIVAATIWGSNSTSACRILGGTARMAQRNMPPCRLRLGFEQLEPRWALSGTGLTSQ
jgi:hypothetical protein